MLIIVEGHRYEVTSEFKHPGEGIRGMYLADFSGKDVSEDFERYHMTNEPWEILEKAREQRKYKGIIYLGPVS
jgi:hypothetical protein